MTLPIDVECQEKHGYVLVDLQHIVRNHAFIVVQCFGYMLSFKHLSVAMHDLGHNSIIRPLGSCMAQTYL